MPVSVSYDTTTQVHRLFFAIRPDAAVATAACDLARRACASHGLPGRPQDAERLHVTLHWLRDHAGLPPDLVDAARRAGAAVTTGPFPVRFTRLESLGGVRRGGPLVLGGGDGLRPLRRFQRELAGTMVDAGLGAYAGGSFRPHMTLLYERTQVSPEPIEPLRWTVDELVLVDSLVGRHRYVVLARWPLRRRQMAFDW